jgi:hypothetical protein
VAYATCKDCNVTFNVPETGDECAPCQRCGGRTEWLVPPEAMAADALGHDGLVGDVLAPSTPHPQPDAVDLPTSSSDTRLEVDYRHNPSDAPPSAPRDSATRRLESDAGISDKKDGEGETDESTINMFRQPVPPIPKLSAPTIRGSKPTGHHEDSLPSSTLKSTDERHWLRVLAPVVILLSAVFGGVLAWIISRR